MMNLLLLFFFSVLTRHLLASEGTKKVKETQLRALDNNTISDLYCMLVSHYYYYYYYYYYCCCYYYELKLRSAHVDVPAEMQHSDQHGIERPIVESRHARRSSVVAFVQHVHAVTETE